MKKTFRWLTQKLPLPTTVRVSRSIDAYCRAEQLRSEMTDQQWAEATGLARTSFLDLESACRQVLGVARAAEGIAYSQFSASDMDAASRALAKLGVEWENK